MAIRNVLRKIYPLAKVDSETAQEPLHLPPEPSVRAPEIDWVTVTDTFLWNWYNKPDPKRIQGIFHPSAGLHPDVGGCDRMTIFDLLMATRSPKKVSAKLARVLMNGSDRHLGLQGMFHAMAKQRHMGILHYEAEVLATHPTLPLSGRADGYIVMADGHRYLHDYKTIGPDDFDKTFEPTLKHRLQLNTYMGMLGVRTGYMIYENKKGQAWATPMPKFRVDFSPMLFNDVENHCHSILQMVAKSELPAFSEKTCKDSITFCHYEMVCKQHRTKMATFSAIDKRDSATKKRHLEVLQ